VLFTARIRYFTSSLWSVCLGHACVCSLAVCVSWSPLLSRGLLHRGSGIHVQARSYDEATASPLGSFLKTSQTRLLSHPLPVLRAREIDRWAAGREYRALIADAGVVGQP
jgi:hypothetical protein